MDEQLIIQTTVQKLNWDSKEKYCTECNLKVSY